MNLGAGPWLVDFHAAAARDSFPFSSFFYFWCFLSSKVRVWGVSYLIGLSVLVLVAFFFVLPTPPTQCWATVWVVGPLS